MGLRGYSMPGDIYFLCLLHNVGATSIDRSMTLEEISRWTVTEPERVRDNLEKLINASYVQRNLREDTERYHVTINGIRKVLSMYS